MDTNMRIIWTCNGSQYDECIVPEGDVAMTLGILLANEWNHFGQDGDKIEIVEVM